jgi:D-beta-D-heptose 7-phosphate kinase/D-beta-D-heptose 1-phosphate adenosyltransferase
VAVKSRLIETITGARRPTVLVVGDVMRDLHWTGKVDRISPEAPVPVFVSTGQNHMLGGAANVAANLQALGCKVYLLSVIGDDESGRALRELLRKNGIDDSLLLEDPSRPTTEKTRLLASQQQLLRIDHESRAPLAVSLVSSAVEQAESLLKEVDGVLCSDYDKGFCTPELLDMLFTAARNAQRPIFVDPKVRDFSRYRGATILTPNLLEVERAVGSLVDTPEALARAADSLLQQTQARALLVTQGKDGMTLFHPPEASVHIPARARDVFDITGAGDTAIAAFSMAVLSGLSLVEAAQLSNAAAGIVIGKVGAATVSPEELQTVLEEEDSSWRHKVLQRHELVRTLQWRRQKGERIGFTNGCFDLLHVGHIRYLQQARASADCLVVAINDDRSVRLLKGEKRPLIPQHERARILAALTYVDYVTLFSEPTPLALIELLQPDVLIKGGDYTLDTVVGRDVVNAYGGEVHLVPDIDGMSTTAIIESIIKRYS